MVPLVQANVLLLEAVEAGPRCTPAGLPALSTAGQPAPDSSPFLLAGSEGVAVHEGSPCWSEECAGPDSRVGSHVGPALELSVHPGRLGECFPCGPGG